MPRHDGGDGEVGGAGSQSTVLLHGLQQHGEREFEPRYRHFRPTWGVSLPVDMTQTLTSHQRFPASSVITETYPRLHYHHHSWRNVPVHPVTGSKLNDLFF